MSLARPAAAPVAGPVVGLDLGGTKIAAALVAPDGTVRARYSRPTPATEGADAVLDALAHAAAAVRGGTEACAVGVAAAGVVDPEAGTVRAATSTIAGWSGVRLAPLLAARTGCPVACDNDVRAAAAAEYAALEEPGASLLHLSVGTGVGGAVVAGGRMLRGSAGVAGHLGHLPSPEAAGLPCSCGVAGHLEAVAAGPGIAALYARLAGGTPASLEEVARRAAAGDRPAAEAITTGATAAGRALGGLANALGPGHVVVGGGVTGIGGPYWAPLRAAFAAELIEPLRSAADSLVPRPPLAGPDAPVLGAAALTATAPLHAPHTGEAR
ncbi:ROK family protein [Streptomyces sp. NRRL F-5126]|uniref:ROK family protein n=1 Tax=Streptomyces sp. NRRL F-5126 TaxID=1463857 RepID=UPI001F29DE48|nr:ROK family protein [Streptomyces sp. NRRL F-5126]